MNSIILTSLWCSSGLIKIKACAGTSVILLVIYFLGSVGSKCPVNLLQTLDLSSVDRVIASKQSNKH